MKLVSILSEALIFDHLQGKDRESIYREMLSRAAEVDDVELNVNAALKKILEREDLCPMPYNGVALPHARLEELNDLYIIVGLLDQPIKLKESDLAPSKVIVMSLISETTSDTYLKAVAALSKHLVKPGALEAMLQAADTPDHFLRHIALQNITMKKVITAEDLMSTEVDPVTPEDSLSKALDIYNSTRIMLLPVVDKAGRLVGELSAINVVKSFIPDYIFMMDNLNFLNNFELFNQIFKEENRLAVSKYMTPVKGVISSDTPLIQITVRLTRGETPVFFVVDQDQKLIGKVAINDIIHKVIRG